MESTDERGRMKMYIAALDAFELHNSHLNRTSAKVLSQDELDAVDALRNSTEYGKSLIKTAIETARNTDIAQQAKKVS